MSLPTDPAGRKALPIMSGFLDYFPNAAAMVAYVSKVGNDQHNPGQPLHWARGKSSDHADACARHLMERGRQDSDGILHSAKAAWRAMANLEEELWKLGAEPGRAVWDEEEEDARYEVTGPAQYIPEEEPFSGTISPADLRAYIDARMRESQGALGQPDAPSPNLGSGALRPAPAESRDDGPRMPSGPGRVLQFAPRPPGNQPDNR